MGKGVSKKREPADDKVRQIINDSVLIEPSDNERKLCQSLIASAYSHARKTKTPFGISIAMAYDLCMSAEYYELITNRGWLYCPNNPNLLSYPYVNACPRCMLSKKFVFHSSNKPQSGSIGSAASRWLAIFYNELFRRKGYNVEIRKGKEPIDLVVYERDTKTVLFAEVKASPLATLPLAFESDELTEIGDDGLPIKLEHTETDHTSLKTKKLSIFLPVPGSKWSWKLVPYGIPSERGWSHEAMLKLVKSSPNFFKNFQLYWERAYHAYSNKLRDDPIYWFTNACGQPSPAPAKWPRRARGRTGYESVSDSKTSVGMDRTDDIKKGTYQVLKLGAETKPNVKAFAVRTGLVSNIHAVRHFEEYLKNLEDVVWTSHDTGKISIVKDLNPNAPVYNLFDGIITFTQCIARDDWIENHFKFD